MPHYRVVIQSVPASNCPECGKTCNALGGAEKARPGDFTICSGCGTVLGLDNRLHMRRLRPEEKTTLAADDGLQQQLRVVRPILDRIWQAQAAERN